VLQDEIYALIRDHTVPGTTLYWWSREYGTWGKLADAIVKIGALDDGRWWVWHYRHSVSGPDRAELYWTKDDAWAVAEAVMAEAAPRLAAAGYRPWELW